MENDLCRVDIHHTNITAKDFSDANRFKCALNRKLFLSIGSEERHLVADLQTVAVGKGAGKQYGVGLREEDERIGNVGLRLVKLIIAQLVVSSGVHSQDEQRA